MYALLDANGKEYRSKTKGTLGGYKKNRIYGELHCKSALRAIEKSGYTKERVFFKNEETAIRAGYRPCAVCMPVKYKKWKKDQAK